MKTRQEMIDELVDLDIQTVIDLVRDGDYGTVTDWLGNLFRDEYVEVSDEELKGDYESEFGTEDEE